MDKLPDLRSDADVDSLMARLQAKLGPSPAATHDNTPPSPSADVTLRDLFSLQQELVSVVTRAMQLIVETLDDLDADRAERPSPAANRERVNGPAGSAGRVAADVKERSRSTRPVRMRRPAAPAKPAGRPPR
jgi:hypothetical protein